MRRVRQRGGSSSSGYALIAAVLVMFLLMALGIMAMVTSVSEQRIAINISQDKLMFGYGEQGVNRVLSHLHYLPEGLYGAVEGAGLTDNGVHQVLTDARDLYFTAVEAPLNKHPQFNLDAWLDPKDYEKDGSGNDQPWDKGMSRPVAISVLVRNDGSPGFAKAFRAKARPYSIWDFAYYSQNHNPAERAMNNGSCNQDSPNWYGCQSVFHNEDSVIGDIYVRTQSKLVDDTKLFLRGAPKISGRIMWRNLSRFDYGSSSGSDSPFQTKGGSNLANPPTFHMGIRNYAKEVGLFPMRYLTDDGGNWFRQNADITLHNRPDYMYKIVFRNDLDTNNDGLYETSSRVASHITRDMVGSKHSDDPGIFLLYSIPWAPAYDVNGAPTDPFKHQMITAFYGDSMYYRDQCLRGLNPDCIGGGEIWSPTVGWRNSVAGACSALRLNQNGGLVTRRPIYDDSDIHPSYYYIYTPSVGAPRSTWPDGGCSGTSSGIIFVEGDVAVEGILNGKTTIVATGNIYLSHEVRYEEAPKNIRDYTDLNDMDMLGLFATGNIIIPNFYPDPRGGSRGPFFDDWSDAGLGSGWEPTGGLDHPAITDDGNEQVDAVMVSWGYQPCTVSGSSITCTAPTLNDIQNFKVGIYAMPRTSNGNPWSGSPCCGSYDAQGNNSGLLTVYGSMIENYSGRVSFDHSTSTCTAGSGAGCRNLGHQLNLQYDERLRYTLPAIPWDMQANRGIPFGQAAWEIVEWKEIDPAQVNQPVW